MLFVNFEGDDVVADIWLAVKSSMSDDLHAEILNTRESQNLARMLHHGQLAKWHPQIEWKDVAK